jgi:threonine dehydrogenase-like Zn-dependent dehydrogenase
MKVLRAYGPKDLRVVEVPKPEPGPGMVRIKVRASGICGSDKGWWDEPGYSDFVAGHEVAGEVEKLGPGVYSLATGDRVAVNNVVGCGTCPDCRAGAFVLCPYWDGTKDVNNGFGEYVTAPVENCLKIPQGLDFIDGSLIMDNWGTPYGGIKRVGVTNGTDVLVNGCGPIGQAAVALCAALGAYVTACDPVPFRREMALRNGARFAFEPEGLPEAIRGVTDGLGVHAVLECSGAGASYGNCLDALRTGGTLVAIGEGAVFTQNASEPIIRRTLAIQGSWYSTMPQAAELMQMAAAGRINPKCFLTHTTTLDEVPSLFGDIVACRDGLMKCVILFD